MQMTHTVIITGVIGVALTAQAWAGLIVDPMSGTPISTRNLAEGVTVTGTGQLQTANFPSDPDTFRLQFAHSTGTLVYAAPTGFIFNQKNFSFKVLQSENDGGRMGDTLQPGVFTVEYDDNATFSSPTTINLNVASNNLIQGWRYLTLVTPDTFEAEYVRITLVPGLSTTSTNSTPQKRSFTQHLGQLDLNLDPIPEPASLSILGLAGLMMLARRR